MALKTAKPPTEAVIQRHVCQYLKSHYPFVIFNSDGAGNNVSKAQAGMNKVLRSNAGYPDLFIAQPVGVYHGLFIELKRDGTTVYLKNGEMTTNPHIRDQAEVLAELRARGYFADFAVGYEEAKTLIDAYLNSNKPCPSRLLPSESPELHPAQTTGLQPDRLREVLFEI